MKNWPWFCALIAIICHPIFKSQWAKWKMITSVWMAARKRKKMKCFIKTFKWKSRRWHAFAPWQRRTKSRATFESSQMLTRHQRLSESYRSLFHSTRRLLSSFHFQSCIAEVWIRAPPALVNSSRQTYSTPCSLPVSSLLPTAFVFVLSSEKYYWIGLDSVDHEK